MFVSSCYCFNIYFQQTIVDTVKAMCIYIYDLEPKGAQMGESDFWLSIKSVSNTLSCGCFVCAFIIGQYHSGNNTSSKSGAAEEILFFESEKRHETRPLKMDKQHCLLPSLVDDFTCVHSKNALLTHILSTLFSSTSVLFCCTPFGTKSIGMLAYIHVSIMFPLSLRYFILGKYSSAFRCSQVLWDQELILLHIFGHPQSTVGLFGSVVPQTTFPNSRCGRTRAVKCIVMLSRSRYW